MLSKLFNVRKIGPFARCVSTKPAAPATQPEVSSSVLKIVHIGGFVEHYYTAVPAVRIIEKYPSFILARPEVFRRPWDSVVRKDEILTPGEKILVVPRRTVKKLRQRTRIPDREVSVNSFASKASTDASFDMVSCSKKDDFSFPQNEVIVSSEESRCTALKNSFRKKSATRKQARFFGIDIKRKADCSYTGKNTAEVEEKKPEKGLNSQSPAGKRGARIASKTWQPSLDAISEKTEEKSFSSSSGFRYY